MRDDVQLPGRLRAFSALPGHVVVLGEEELRRHTGEGVEMLLSKYSKEKENTLFLTAVLCYDFCAETVQFPN